MLWGDSVWGQIEDRDPYDQAHGELSCKDIATSKSVFLRISRKKQPLSMMPSVDSIDVQVKNGAGLRIDACM